MAKFKFNRINWKNILIIFLTLVLGIGAIAGVSSLVKNEKTTLSSLEFKRGALNDLGFYIESDQSIYTKDLIECQGLEIEPDFETLGEYQVYYYDSNKQFLGKTDKIDSQTDGVYVKGNDFVVAKYCRIVITPDAAKDEDGDVVEDYAIKFYEVAGIAGKYKISVDKKQKYKWNDVYVADESMVGKYYRNSLTDIAEMGSYIPSEVFDLEGCKEIIVVVKNFNQEDALAQLCLIDSNGSFVETIDFESDNIENESNFAYVTVTIPDGVTSAVLNGVYNNNYCIYVR